MSIDEWVPTILSESAHYITIKDPGMTNNTAVTWMERLLDLGYRVMMGGSGRVVCEKLATLTTPQEHTA